MAVGKQSLTLLAERLGQALLFQGAQVTVAESCTGGGIAEVITRIPGSSAWFEVGFVTYSNRQKTRQLQVAEEQLNSCGAVSQEVVEAMVRGAQAQSGASYAAAVSGVAGPAGGSADKPVGTVWIAWAAAERVCSQRFLFAGDRAAIRRQTIQAALEGLLALLQENSSLD